MMLVMSMYVQNDVILLQRFMMSFKPTIRNAEMELCYLLLGNLSLPIKLFNLAYVRYT